jgi:hypothetical protein
MNSIQRLILLIAIMATIIMGCNSTPSTSQPNVSDLSGANVFKKAKEPVSSASHQEEHGIKPTSDPKTETEKQTPSTKQSQPHTPLPVFNKEDFTLMGVSIGEDRALVVKWFGEPPYIYESKSETVDQIHEYDGYTVGYSVDGKVNWISVTSNKIDPLLNEIFVGSSEEKVLKILGKPDHKNEYQLQYVHPIDSLTLKLDIDPFTSIVQSISLFKNE